MRKTFLIPPKRGGRAGIIKFSSTEIVVESARVNGGQQIVMNSTGLCISAVRRGLESRILEHKKKKA